MISYDNTTLVPRKVPSTIKHRATDCDTTVDILGVTLHVPMIASPMHDVCNGDMAVQLRMLGALGLIHRFQSIEEQVKAFKLANDGFVPTDRVPNVGCAVGVNGDFEERARELWQAGCRIFCIDTANGANDQVASAVATLRLITLPAKSPGTAEYGMYIIAGNIATKEGYEYLARLGVDAVRVGIAGGSVCETRTETGVYMPTLESVKECYGERCRLVRLLKKEWEELPLIIADGGIRIPADMNKAIAVGADVVMCGSVFSGAHEAPGEPWVDEDGITYKLFRGSASFGIQKIASGEEPDYVEGREKKVKYKGKVEKIVRRFQRGLESSMSYFNARTLNEYRANVSVELL